MRIILENGIEKQPLMVTGARKYVQGANRDSLTFVFDETASLDEMDSIFTEANCENIKIYDTVVEEIEVTDEETGEVQIATVEKEVEAIHTGYTIRAELTKADVVAEQATAESEAVTVKRVTVTMAQRTYAESKLAQVAAESTDTQLAVAELAEIVMGV